MKLKFYLLIILPLIFLGQSAVLRADNGDSEEAAVILKKAQAVFASAIKQSGENKRLNMLKAAGLFQSADEKFGFKSGGLYYNIGNAYYEAGSAARAILNYRRAERLTPGLADLEHNLKQARQRLNLPVKKDGWTTNAVKSVFFWHFILDYGTRRLIFAISFASVWLFLLWLLFQKNFLAKTGVAISLAATCAFGGSYLTSAIDNNQTSGVIVISDTVARKGPGLGYQPFYQQPLSGGIEFKFLEKQDEWAKIKLFNGDEVWLKIENIEFI